MGSMSFLNRAEEASGTKLAVRVNNYRGTGAANGRTIYAGYKHLRGSATYLRGAVLDANGAVFIKSTVGGHSPADIHVAETAYYVKTGSATTDDYVMKSAYVVLQCIVTNRYV